MESHYFTLRGKSVYLFIFSRGWSSSVKQKQKSTLGWFTLLSWADYEIIAEETVTFESSQVTFKLPFSTKRIQKVTKSLKL